MEEIQTVVVPPISTEEPTSKSDPLEQTLKEKEAEIAALKQKEVELQKQKEHWREKYERDITSQKLPEPAPSEDEELYSDEGKKLKGEISTLGDKLRDVERRESRRETETEFPVLKDKKEEFDAFLEDEENKRLSIKKAAKLFLAEKNLLVQETPERKGLEAPTGGGQKPPEGKPTDEEIENIRKTDFRKYEKLIRERKI